MNRSTTFNVLTESLLTIRSGSGVAALASSDDTLKDNKMLREPNCYIYPSATGLELL